MKAKHYFIILLGIVVVCASASWMMYKKKANEKAIHIAMVAPFSGTYANIGNSLKQGVELFLKEINEKGGVNGHKILLKVYDDQNDPKRANMQALAVAKESRAVAVIGHFYSSASIEGGKVYKKYEIPAITPTSTNDEVTLDNPWYFRTIFNDSLQGRFLANYAKYVLHQDTVSIIHENIAYGQHLAQVFEKTAQELGMTVKNTWQFDVEDKEGKHDAEHEKLHEEATKIVDEINKNRENSGLIFLAAREHEGIEFIRLIKDLGIKNPIFVPDALSSKDFSQGFKNFPQEKNNSGFYTDDIYVTTPLIFDTASKKAHQFKALYKKEYHVDPDWRAAFTYDTAKILIEGMKQMNIQGGQDDAMIKADRQKMQAYLNTLNNPNNAVEGITGINYFDKFGNADKLISVGVYKNNRIISAPTQLQNIQNLTHLSDSKIEQQEGRILAIDKNFMYKTNVVYTGIEMKKINNLDIGNLTHDLEFYLWFRYQDDTVNPQNIEFLNAVEPIKLCHPKGKKIQKNQENTSNTGETLIENAITDLATKIQSEEKIDIACMPILEEKYTEDFIYHLYLVKGKFHIDFLPNHYFGQHMLGLNFHHVDLNRNYLIYVVDTLGMGAELQYMLEMFENKQFFQSNDWKVNEVLFFQDVMKKNSHGDPDYLNLEQEIEFSRYNVRIRVQKQSFTMRGIISEDQAHPLLTISMILLLLLSLSGRNISMAKIIWFFQVILVFAILTSLEVLLLAWQARRDEYDLYTLSLIVKGFDVLWWVMAAVLLNIAVKRFLWMPLEKQTGRAVPRLVRNFASFAIYLLGFFFIVAFVFDQKITSLLATSGMVAMIIGLAIQVNIANVFSGLAINVERPFRIGDWIKIGDFEEGKVLDVTWRTTRIETSDNCVLSIPNSVASESVIHNYCYPDNIFEASVEVTVNSKYSPKQVEKILIHAISSIEGILKKPEPSVKLKEIQQQSAIYTVAYFTSNYENLDNLSSEVWKHIWNQLNRASIAPTVQKQNVDSKK